VKHYVSVRVLAVFFAAAVLAGCAASTAHRRGDKDIQRGEFDAAVMNFSKAVALDPGNTRYSVALERAKLKASAGHFEKGKRYAAGLQWDLAVGEFQQALLLYPGNQHAADALDRAQRQIQRQQAGTGEIERRKAEARRKALAPPKLSPTANIPILLNFRETPVGKIFEAIGKASGINFIFDDKTDLKRPMTIDIGNVTLEKALDILMLQTKNFYKVIDESTLLIAPDQRQKRQEYEDNVIRTFYLSNGDPKQVVTLLRSLLQSRQIAENTALNSVTIKDTPDKAAVAERIIEANDKAKGEIVVDVQLIEVDRVISQALGIDLSSKTFSLSFQGGGKSLPLNGLSVLKQSGNWLIGEIPSVIVNYLKSNTDFKLIAQPQVRVSEGEKAEILIGDRVPIPTTSFNTSNTVGGNVLPITSFTYQNVGITLQIEPRVHHNQEITMKVSVEVSQVTGAVEQENGPSQPIIGTRNIQTTIRLRDGETNLLAGLIRQEERKVRSGVVGLSDIPGLNNVLGSTRTDRTDTDIIMTLTPRIIRIPDITEEDLATLWVGTEDNMQLRGPTRGLLGESPFASPEPAEGEAATTEAAAEPAPAAPETKTDAATGSKQSGGVSTIAPAAGGAMGQPQPRPPEPEQEPIQDDKERQEGAQQEVHEGEPAPPPENPPDRGGTSGTNPDTQNQPTAPAVVRVVPSSPTYRVGDLVTLEVRIENGTNVGSVPFHLRYNPQMLQFQSPAQEGPFLASDGTSTVFLANDSGAGGEVVVGLSRMGGGTGVEGSGPLATFTFRATAPGRVPLTFTAASVKDPQARNMPASFVGGSIAIVP